MEDIIAGIGAAFTLSNIVYLGVGITVGIIIGAIPGLSAPMAIAIAVPMTYYLPAVSAIGLLIGINKGATFGGSATAILLNTPGTPEAVVATFDGHPLAQQGKSEKAMKVALYADIIGDTFSDIVLILVAAPLALVALMMGPVEIASMLIFSLLLVIALEAESIAKGMIACCLGILIGCIGLDPLTSGERLTFGNLELQNGISLVGLGIGMLALSEIFLSIHKMWINKTRQEDTGIVLSKNPEDRQLSWKEFKSILPATSKSSVMGTTMGILPGLGAIIAAYLGYASAKKSSKNPESFGRGNLEGVAAPVAASAAVCGANLVPLFTLGIPGNVAAAMLIGAFVIHGVTPGPLMFEENGVLIYGIFACLIIANVLNFFLGNIFLRFFSKVLKLSNNVIFPVICLTCMVGAYSESSSFFAIDLMLATAILGYFMKLLRFPFVSLLLGFILGPRLELSLQQLLMVSDNGIWVLFTSPVSAVFMMISLIVVVKVLAKQVKMFIQRGKVVEAS